MIYLLIADSTRLIWLSRVVDTTLGVRTINISQPEGTAVRHFSREPERAIIVPARNEEASIEQALPSSSLDMITTEVIAINDRPSIKPAKSSKRWPHPSDCGATGVQLALREVEWSTPELKVIHIRELPQG
jgi:hypothetical protein